MNPLDWNGTDFLTLFVPLAGAVLLVLCYARSHIGSGSHGQDLTGLGVFHMAYLRSGPQHAIDTALVGLFEAGAASLDRSTRLISIDRSVPVAPEFAPYRHISQGEGVREQFLAEFATRVERCHNDLAQRGLVPDPAAVGRFRAGAIAALAVPLALGGAKIAVGLSRERPVGLLTFCLVATVLAGCWIIWSPPYRTAAGSAALDKARRANARAARAPVAGELALAFALTGAAALDDHDFRAFLKSPSSGSDAGDGGGDGGGGCGGCSA